ncbi:MAG: peptidoglycan DD-metalloendopeptidase family protein [Spirochaetaceae bacterium]|nr:peptidoglycan DD-metalloendopeptidase family protein [Spirochaetaceae bacterium]
MSNRENFDMDGRPYKKGNDSQRNNDSNKGNTTLVIVGAIFIVIAFIFVYFGFIQKNGNSGKQTKVVSIVDSLNNVDASKSNAEVITPQKAPTPVTTINDSVKPILAQTSDSNIARDLGSAKYEKAKEDAVQFHAHLVMDGEDIQSIAKLYGLKVQTLISINSIKNITGVIPGVELIIPDRNGQYYIVEKGDMLSTIASEYSPMLGWKTLQLLNGLTDTKLDVGDKIFIPDMSEVASHPAMSNAIAKFSSPTTGTVISRYGQALVGNIYDPTTNLEGILLQGSGLVKASSEGIVLDMGEDENTSFLIISHKESYETVYKNITNIKVSIGDKVKTGDVLGDVELTGEKELPILYFSIRQSGIPLDPQSFF